MRTILLLGALLVTAAAPGASAGALAVFDDPRGDVGPWPTMVVGVGLTDPGWADLLGASAAPGQEGGLEVEIRLAELPASLPPDAIWAVGGKVPGSDGYWAVGYVHLLTGPGETHAGAAVCTFEASGAYGPEGEPTCEEVPADVAPGAPGAIRIHVPAALAVAALEEPGGVVLLEPGSTAWPLAFLHLTGLTVLDVGWSDGTLDLPRGEQALETATLAEGEVERAVPAAGAAALGALAAGALAARRRVPPAAP